MNDWQLIKTAPLNLDVVLLYQPAGPGNAEAVGQGHRTDLRDDAHDKWVFQATGWIAEPTHWMPLPPPPPIRTEEIVHMTATRLDPHASYREHVSSEAEAVEEDVKLLPCPFCGHPPQTWTGSVYHAIGCGHPDCEVNPTTDTNNQDGFDKAAAAWNTRADIDTRAALNSGEQK